MRTESSILEDHVSTYLSTRAPTIPLGGVVDGKRWLARCLEVANGSAGQLLGLRERGRLGAAVERRGRFRPGWPGEPLRIRGRVRGRRTFRASLCVPGGECGSDGRWRVHTGAAGKNGDKSSVWSFAPARCHIAPSSPGRTTCRCAGRNRATPPSGSMKSRAPNGASPRRNAPPIPSSTSASNGPHTSQCATKPRSKIASRGSGASCAPAVHTPHTPAKTARHKPVCRTRLFIPALYRHGRSGATNRSGNPVAVPYKKPAGEAEQSFPGRVCLWLKPLRATRQPPMSFFSLVFRISFSSIHSTMPVSTLINLSVNL